jgi:hypothetical protein
MAWYNNHYQCDDCCREWQDEWSCMCDDDCPFCGARHMTPYDSEDLAEIIKPSSGEFIVLRSPDSAEDKPCYEEIDRFSTLEAAEAYLAGIKARERS